MNLHPSSQNKSGTSEIHGKRTQRTPLRTNDNIHLRYNDAECANQLNLQHKLYTQMLVGGVSEHRLLEEHDFLVFYISSS